MNIQSQSIPDDFALSFLSNALLDNSLIASNPSTHISPDTISSLYQNIASAKKPLLLLGGGAATPCNREYSHIIISSLGIPVVLSLMAVDVLDYNHPLRVGFIGSYGNRWANKILSECDFLLAVGTRLDIRQTGSNIESFCDGKNIWQVDIDSSEFNVRVPTKYSICANIQDFSDALNSQSSQVIQHSHFNSWLDRISILKAKYPAEREYPDNTNNINPILFLQSLCKFTRSLPTNFCY